MYEKSGFVQRRLEEEDWFPRQGVMECTERGSMETSVIPAFVNHIHSFFRTVLTFNKPPLLSLEGHGSPNGIDGLEICASNGCEVVMYPTNTSNVLQSCGQLVKKKFLMQLCTIIDELAKLCILDTRSIRFNLVFTVHAYEAITVKDIRDLFSSAGVFLFKPSFGDRFEKENLPYDSGFDEKASNYLSVKTLPSCHV